jgi:hypothetical protein
MRSMKTLALSLFSLLILSVMPFSALAEDLELRSLLDSMPQQAPIAVSPAGYLADFNYQISNVTPEMAQSLMDGENTETSSRSICANRANMWSYMMNRTTGVQVGKVFIHFTALGQADENGEWAYHVAPYIIVNGEEMVLDNGFSVFNGEPSKMSDWMKYFGKSDHCTVLDPIHNPHDLALEQNNLPSDSATPLHFKGGARQYPVENGAICYVRKVPMYYTFPFQVYGTDLARASADGMAKYGSEFMFNNFNTQEVLNSCNQARTFWSKMKNSCSKYLGL